ncbi:MAG: hypothetical protein QXM04_01275 [Nanopusillaceae archaeon]
MNKIYFNLEVVINILKYIPDKYLELARAWGIRDTTWGPIIAFGTSWALISAIVWLGLTLSFGKLGQNDESIKKALRIIAFAIGGFATYGAAEFVVYVLSDFIYLFTIIISGIVLFSIFKAVSAGIPAAGATIYEAKKLEEEARREYEEERHKRMLALKKIIDELSFSLEITEKILDDIISNLSNLPGGIQTYGHYIRKLEELKQKINNSKGKPSAMYATLNESIYILEEILGIQELHDKIKNNLKNVIDRIKKVTEPKKNK